MTGEPTPSQPNTPGGMQPNAVAASIARLDRISQTIVSAGIVVAVGAILGVALETWRFDYAGLLLLLAGAAGAAIAWLAAERRLPQMPLTAGDLLVAASAVAAALGILALLTILFDLDQLGDEYGGVVGLLVTVITAGAGLAMLAGSFRMASLSLPAARGIRIGIAGAALALLGWAGNVTIGVWNFTPSAMVVALIVLAAVVLHAAGRRLEQGTASPVPLSWAAVVLAGLATLLMIDHFRAFSDLMSDGDLGVENWLVFLLYAIGVLILLGGAILTAIDERRPATAAA